MKFLCQSSLLLLALILLLGSCREGKKKKLDTMTSGVVSIAVDETFQPVISEEIDVFESLYPQASIIPYYQNEVETMNLILQDSVRLAITTRGLTDAERKNFEARKFRPREIHIATDGIAVIVNKANPDSLMSLSMLQKILTGEVTQWNQIYPNSKLKDIRVVFDNPNSSTVRFAIDSICRGKPLSTELNAVKTNEAVFDYVRNTPGALGFIGVNWVGNAKDTTNLTFADEITVMGISRNDNPTLSNSFQPYAGYLALGDYPLRRNIYIILNDPRGGLISGFTTFVTSFRGQRIIVRAGMAPATQQVRIVNVRNKIQ